MPRSDFSQEPFDSQERHTVHRRRKRRRRAKPPLWLMAVLVSCVALLVIYPMLQRDGGQAVAVPDASASPADVSAPPTPSPTPTPAPTPTPYDYSQPVPEREKVEMEWFSDAVFIGDSRTDGLRLFSGISGADFLAYTGITVHDIMNDRRVIRDGDQKISILDALARKQYGKVYVSLGVNELGYFDPEGFAETYGRFIDAIRVSQPDAKIYVQSLIPVNSAKCDANNISDYVTNEGIANYNASLAAETAAKQAYWVDVAAALIDETGEVSAEDSADGVHFQKSGYIKWLDYLMTHTVA